LKETGNDEIMQKAQGHIHLLSRFIFRKCPTLNLFVDRIKSHNSPA
jgi:hypothetical protein